MFGGIGPGWEMSPPTTQVEQLREIYRDVSALPCVTYIAHGPKKCPRCRALATLELVLAAEVSS